MSEREGESVSVCASKRERESAITIQLSFLASPIKRREVVRIMLVFFQHTQDHE